MVEYERNKSLRDPRSYRKMKEMQAKAVAELEQLGMLTPRLQAYLAFREVFPKKGRMNSEKTELRSVEQLLVYDSGVIFHGVDSVLNCNSWDRDNPITPDAIRKWAFEYPDHGETVNLETTIAEDQARLFVERLRVDMRSRDLLQQVFNRIESAEPVLGSTKSSNP